MFPLYTNYLRPSFGDDQRLYWDYDADVSVYEQKVLDYSPLAFWPLRETVGDTARCLVDADQNGAYTGVTLASILGPDGIAYAPLFDGSAGFVDIYTAALESVFDGDEGTLGMWIHPKDAWGSAGNEICAMFREDVNNRIRIYHDTGNNLVWRRSASGTTINQDKNISAEDLDWHHVALTWSASAGATGELVAYWDGAAIGGAQANIDNYAGTLTDGETVIGAIDSVPGSLWDGYLALVALFGSAQTAEAILDMASAT